MQTLRYMLVTVLSAVVVTLALAAVFCGWSLYVNASDNHSGLQPGTVRYETREFWLSLRDWMDGKEESWTAEWPQIIDTDSL